MKRIVVSLLVLVLVLVVAGAATGTWMATRSHPDVAGEIVVPGLDGEVTVHRDAYGVPTIVASTADDLFRAQGYVHAQDRFWEMDFRRHVTAGRVSELFGSSQLDTDRFVRTLGWRRVAEQELDLLDDATLQMLEAYAVGVNAWVGDQRGSALSFEHGLLPVAGARGYEPEPWTPADSVAWLKAMAWDLRTNLEDELLRGRLQTADLGEGRDWEALFPDYPYDRHRTILAEDDLAAADDYETVDGSGGTDRDADDETADNEAADTEGAAWQGALEAAQQALLAAPQLLGDGTGEGIGSNSWVIAPERSATGGALLANDPHLGPSQPSLWYQVGLRCAEVTDACPFHAAGFSFSGVPGIIIGQTDRVAWGFTNLGPDVADLYVEQIEDGRARTADGWEDLEIIEETIRVAGGDDEPVTIRATRNGPIFSDVSGGAGEIAAGPQGAAAEEAEGGASSAEPGEVEYAVSLRWTALEPGRTMDAVTSFLHARDWESFRDSARLFEVPSQNLVFVDVDGNIGYQAPGRIPVRAGGDGTGPVPAWTGEYEWERYLDFEELPFTFNPPSNQIVTANQPVLPDGVEPFLTRDADLGFRGQRINDLLGDRDGLTLDDLLEVMLDNHNFNAEHLVPYLLDVEVDDDVRTAQAVLRDWDLQDDADSAGGAIFNATWRHLLARTFHDELPEWAWPSGGSRWWELVRQLVDEPDSPWWDDRTTETTETRDDILAAALSDAHADVTDRFGDDPDDWRWGAMHVLYLRHQTFGDSGIGPLERLFNRGPLETAGGVSIVNATGWNAAEGYEVNWVPSLRYLVDASDFDAGRWIHLTGQSGRPFDTHYTDQAELWRDGGTIPLHFSAQAVQSAAEHTLTLTP